MPECRTVWYRNKGTVPQSGIGMLRNRTEMLDAGIPMPAASTLMPMPIYEYIYTVVLAYHIFEAWTDCNIRIPAKNICLKS
jgi:hypothetical protein